MGLGQFYRSKYAWMDLSQVRPFISLMEEREVSKVARSDRGFLTRYIQVRGSKTKLGLVHPETPLNRKSRKPVGWVQRREQFLARHLAQKHKLWEPDGNPTRYHLALIAWAHTPDPKGVKRWIKSAS